MYKNVLLVFLLAAALMSGCGLVNSQDGSGGAAQIAGREWVLTSLNGQAPLADSEITLKLEGDQAGGSSGCNSYGGQYSLRGNDLSFGNLAMTEMACMAEGVMEQESAYLQTLSQVTSFRSDGTRLELKNAAGETVLVFQ